MCTHTQTLTHTCNRWTQDLQLVYIYIYTQKHSYLIYIYINVHPTPTSTRKCNRWTQDLQLLKAAGASAPDSTLANLTKQVKNCQNAVKSPNKISKKKGRPITCNDFPKAARY